MEEIEWSKLLSGTDIRGTAIASQDKEVNLSEEAAFIIGFSFVKWLEKDLAKNGEQMELAIGHDSRLSADKLKLALAKGIKKAGASVFSAGLASTPAMFMSTVLEGYQYDAAIMITASHLPSDRNGFKFFKNSGGLEKEDIKAILKLAAEQPAEIFQSIQTETISLKKIDLISDYADHIKNVIRKGLNPSVNSQKPLADFKIIVDAGNGSGGFFVEQILKDLGADTKGSQFLEPDGNFPNHAPNPESKPAMKAIQKAVKENKADLGIIFDTDVDRAAVVDSTGQEINRNKLIALAATIVLENNPGATIVTDSVTSVGLKEFIEEKLGGVHHRFKRGYKNVINEAQRLENEGVSAPLAIETSGHAAFKENYFLDDGAYLVAKVLIKLANLKVEANQKIGELISDLKEAEIKKEYRMKIKAEAFKSYGQQILADLKEFVKEIENWQLAPKNYQGVRVNCGDNDWFLIRMSLHDPVLVLNIETETKANLELISKKINAFLGKYDKLDLQKLA